MVLNCLNCLRFRIKRDCIELYSKKVTGLMHSILSFVVKATFPLVKKLTNTQSHVNLVCNVNRYNSSAFTLDK